MVDKHLAYLFWVDADAFLNLLLFVWCFWRLFWVLWHVLQFWVTVLWASKHTSITTHVLTTRAHRPLSLQVTTSSGRLCQALKSVVVATKDAAQNYPSVQATQEMVDRVAELSQHAAGFSGLLQRLAEISWCLLSFFFHDKCLFFITMPYL